MGVDIRIHFKKDKRRKESEFIGMSRRFCTMIGDGKHGEKPVLIELSTVLGIDISFFLEAEYYDADDAVYWAELAGLPTNNAKQDCFRSNTFLQTQYLLDKVKALIDRMKEIPDYHERMQYNREPWNNYFGEELQNDLRYLLQVLGNMAKRRYKWISFEIL